MRRSIGALAAAGAVVVGLLAWQADSSTQTCLPTADFDGRTYTQAQTTEEVISGEDLGDGQLHECGSKGPYERSVALSRIPGIDPTIAVASPMAAYVVYLAPGVDPRDLPEKLGTVSVRDPS